jgi:hypothetical protein
MKLNRVAANTQVVFLPRRLGATQISHVVVQRLDLPALAALLRVLAKLSSKTAGGAAGAAAVT